MLFRCWYMRHLSTQLRRNPIGVEPGHANHYKTPDELFIITRKVTVNAPPDSLYNQWQGFISHRQPAFGTQHTMLRGDSGKLCLNRCNRIDNRHINNK